MLKKRLFGLVLKNINLSPIVPLLASKERIYNRFALKYKNKLLKQDLPYIPVKEYFHHSFLCTNNKTSILLKKPSNVVFSSFKNMYAILVSKFVIVVITNYDRTFHSL